MAKILPPAVKNSPNFASGSLKINKILPLVLKNGQNLTSSGKKRSHFFEKCLQKKGPSAEGALPGKMHQGPPGAKAAPA